MIGVICGLRSEAKIADRLPGVLVGCSVARPQRALALARHMVSQGVTRLISFGVAAGLSQELVAGDVILGGSVMTAKNAWEADAILNEKLMEELPSLMCVPVWGSQSIVRRAEDKALVLRRTGCLVTDMESQIVAQVAHENRIPFTVIRAISDPYDMDLPPAALVPLREDGSPDMKGVFQSIKKEPLQLPALIRLGFNTSRALRGLKQVVEVMREIG
ncbi:MAG: hypothetical protein EOM37_04760 [Proteobacteria bacterium]|jgi:adenosylhomocysteine nucleosidase|nr:hypothetical protein [Alphaproteobacteria bacterium]NCC03343.1 hypothetical protein [Pseudomonadota bacterium]